MKSLISKAVLVGQVLLLVAFCSGSWAATPTVPSEASPGAVEKSLAPERPVAPAQIPEIAVEEDERGFLKGGEGVKFSLKGVTFGDNWVFSSEELRNQLTGYIGQTIEVSQLSKLTAIITQYYKERGYFLTRAYIPPQTIKDGIVLINVREGRLGAITITGNRRYSRELIRNTLKVLRGEGAIRTEDVERGLLLLMDYPGLSVKATFKPGDRPGLSDIILDVKEESPVKAGLDYNNFGSKYVSRSRFGASVEAYNLAGRGDGLYLRGVVGDRFTSNLYYGRIEYVLPLGYSGLRFGVNYHNMRYEMGEELDILDAKGFSEGIGTYLSYPIIRSRNLNWFVEAGFDSKNVYQEMIGMQNGKDKIRNAHAGTTIQWLDEYDGNNILSITGTSGLSSVLGGMKEDYTDTIRFYTDISYSKIEGDFFRAQKLPSSFSLLFNLHGQYTHDRLPSSEELSIGGAGTVRGYSQSEFSGDCGAYSNLELRIPALGLMDTKWPGSEKTVGETLQFAVFYDAGVVMINNAMVSELPFDRVGMQGAGLGLRFTYSPSVRFKVDWAKSIGGTAPQQKSIEDNGTWYFQAAFSF